MRKKPQILRQDLIAQSRIFRIEELDLEFANGEKRTYERLLGGSRGSVLVVPMLDDDTVLLIREYSTGSDDYGYGSNNLQLLRTVSVVPSYIQHQTHVILARNLFPDLQQGDEPEPIEVVPWKLSNWQELLAQPDLTEARSIAALYMTRDFLS